MARIAALYVIKDGPYFGDPEIDPWDEERDARSYSGPHKVIAHPPCERWGRYWGGGPMLHGTPRQRIKGDDGGCFAAALASVRKWGGVLEHPEASHAWAHHGLARPPLMGGWVKADEFGGWTCCVAQGHYGHRAQKLTWLYAVGTALPELTWGLKPGQLRMDDGYHTREERGQRARLRGYPVKQLSKKERASTPDAFKQVLIDMILKQ